MKNENPRDKPPFDPSDFPALREFCPAYLHQEFGVEYGSAAGAVKDFLADAARDDVLQVKEEWLRFRKSFSRLPLEAIQSAIRRLGGAWLPESEADLKMIDDIFSGCEP